MVERFARMPGGVHRSFVQALETNGASREAIDMAKFAIRDARRLERLGGGAYGQVVRAECRGKMVAIKTISGQQVSCSAVETERGVGWAKVRRDERETLALTHSTNYRPS